ncbi:hypothetical protein H4R19_004698 [Coemansia spiralis]|nr:hypothetical protein H4R19_004698 [Coemansia spiralis]
MAQRIAMHSPERWQGSLPAAYAGPQSAPGPRSNVGAADHYRASTSMATHIASPPLLPHPTSSLSPQQHYQQPAPPRYPNSAPTGASSYSAAAHAPAAGNHPLYMPARSAPHPDSALPHEAIPAAAVAMGVNDADIAMPNDTDEKILRRKRNAQSASRLRERRKQREADLEEAVAKLEAKIAELKKELAYEKQRAKERLRPGEMPDLSAAEPSDAESTAKSMSGAVAVGNKRLRGLCESPSASNASCRRAVALPETCPLRELDIVRFSELRTCIGALSELNQKIWVSVGSLRQGIQRISQNSAAKKAETAVAAH